MSRSKFVFVFPGQGAHQVGMGKEYYDRYDWVKEMWEEANSIIGFDLKDKVMNGPKEELKKTRITQSAVYMTEVIMSEALIRNGVAPSVVAGHSLGEYAAVVATGALNWKQGLKLVQSRGEIFEDVANKHPGGMMAIIGMEEDKLSEIINNVTGVCEIVNYNSPGQIVLSADKNLINTAAQLIKEGGAKMVIPLDVSGGFHSSLMNDALNPMRDIIESIDFKDPEILLYSNCTGERADSVLKIKENLIKQVNSPVKWNSIIDNILKENGDDIRFIEVGPGKVLQGLMKRINRKINISGTSAPADIEKIKQGAD